MIRKVFTPVRGGGAPTDAGTYFDRGVLEMKTTENSPVQFSVGDLVKISAMGGNEAVEGMEGTSWMEGVVAERNRNGIRVEVTQEVSDLVRVQQSSPCRFSFSGIT
jgi:hypothetical protein